MSKDGQQDGTRRKVLKGLGLAMIATVSMPAIRPSKAKSQSIVVSAGGGAYEEALKKTIIEPFTQKTGIEVLYQPQVTEASIKAQVSSGRVTVDAVQLAGTVFRPDAEQLLEEIDYNAFDQATLNGLFPGTKLNRGVAAVFFSTNLAFSTAEWPDGKRRPTSWVEFWDTKAFPGPRTMMYCGSGQSATLAFALLAAGVPMDKVYPIDFDKAFASLGRIKPHVVKWWTVGAEPGQLLVDRQVSLASAWNGRIYALQQGGAKVGLEWNQGEITPNHWLVPRGTKNREAAMKFIAYASTAEAQGRFQSLMFYGPSNEQAFDFIKPEIARALPTSPENRKKQFWRDDKWLQSLAANGKTNNEIMIQRWTNWVVS